jgi:hypothetical protein
MKLVKSISLFVLVFGLGLLMTSCSGSDSQSNNSDDQQEEMMHEDQGHHDGTTSASYSHGEGKEYTSAYVCPMHCPESGSEEAGNCPKCGMAYVPLAEHTENGHTH